MQFKINMLTYEGLYKSFYSEKLNIPAIDGRRTLLSNHMPTMIPIDIGVIETANGGKPEYWAVSEGIVMFENNEAWVMCDKILSVDDINIEKAQHSLEKARSILESASRESDITRAQIAFARATNLLRTKDKYTGK